MQPRGITESGTCPPLALLHLVQENTGFWGPKIWVLFLHPPLGTARSCQQAQCPSPCCFIRVNRNNASHFQRFVAVVSLRAAACSVQRLGLQDPPSLPALLFPSCQAFSGPKNILFGVCNHRTALDQGFLPTAPPRKDESAAGCSLFRGSTGFGAVSCWIYVL